MTKHKYNYLGKCVDKITQELRNESYGKHDIEGNLLRDKYGNPLPDWPKEDDFVDNYGFAKNGIKTGYYINVTLPKGTMIGRYGHEGGKLTAPKGTPFEMLSLPYNKETIEYHEYVVIADGIHVKCLVDKGEIFPAFDCPGGGIQYLHPQTIAQELADYKIEEVTEWIADTIKNV